jgi:hypothetical protein
MVTGAPATAVLHAIVRVSLVRGSENVKTTRVSPDGQPGSLLSTTAPVTVPVMPLAWPALFKKTVNGTPPSFASRTSPEEIRGAMGARRRAPDAVGLPA